MTGDPCELICDAICETLNAAQQENPNPFDPVTFTASKPKNPLKELELEFPTIQVFLVPYSETEEKIGRPRYMELNSVSLWVIRKVDPTWTRERMGAVVRAIKEYLRGRRMDCYRFRNAETSTKFDLEQLREKNQFMAIVRLNYFGITGE